MRLKFTTIIVAGMILGFQTTSIAQQWTNTGTNNFGPQELIGIGNTLHTYGIGNFTFESTDDGNTWVADTLNGFTFPVIQSVEAAGGKFFAGDDYGHIYESPDGINWTENYYIGASGPIPYIMYDGTNIYALADGLGVLKSTDNGANWSMGNTGLSNNGNNMNQIVKVGSDLFISTLDGVYKSSDGGTNWVQKNNGLAANMQCNGIAYMSGALLTSGYGFGVFRSTDNGENWTQVTNGFNGFLFVGGFYTYNNLTVVGGSVCKAHFSVDGGLNWTLIGQGNGFGSSVFRDFEVFNGTLFSASSGYCMKISLADLGVNSGISQNGENESSFSAYPNPVKDKINLEFKSNQTHNVTIYNQLGQPVKCLIIQGNNGSFDMSNFSSGVYYFKSEEGNIKVIR